ncbi:CGNR zinc finger domain-containing protein [Amycolatopsis silviterrae]|uniref:CGNR zinc finger domain-containing protein n=1 Tax=Amycolatopsis silviterrae TaxID=1656914 RepID=A0ABW5HGH2_9PSEU
MWMLPDEVVPVRLMATVWADTSGLHDDLRTRENLDAWLDAVGLGSCQSSAAELALAQRLRDAVRRLAAQVTADDRQTATVSLDAALGDLNDLVTHLPVPQLTLVSGELRETSAHDASAVVTGLARVARESIALLGGPDAAKLRACYAPGCVLYFMKTHPRREWCSVACGNRARAARHYEKIRSTR